MAEFTFGFSFNRKRFVAESMLDLVGQTPMVKLSRYAEAAGVEGRILAKLEYFNPLGSAKDRIGIAMIEDAEKKELLKEGGVIIEPTSGNTGIALAFAAVIKGYKLILTMPENMSEERKKMLKALGAELVLTPKEQGMQGAVDKAKELAAEYDNAWIPMQFENPANPDIHKITTAQEILRDTYGKVDCFVCGVGTGGTLTGVATTLKAYNEKIKIIAVEPAASPVLKGKAAAPHGIQGIGANFIPEVLDTSLIDEVIDVSESEAYNAARTVAKTEGLLVGISSGAALFAATVVANRPEFKGKKIVVLLPDSGERYLSTDLFDI